VTAAWKVAVRALPAVLVFTAAPAAAQYAAPAQPWTHDTAALAAAAPAYSLPLPGQPFSRAALTAPAPDPQRREYVEPTPYVLGGTAVGAFAGALVGYVNCVSGDRDCSVLWRLFAGSAIGSALGAVLWLGSVPQP
jgi:hypothetical protein